MDAQEILRMLSGYDPESQNPAEMGGMSNYRDPPYQGTQARAARRRNTPSRASLAIDQFLAGIAAPSPSEDAFGSFQSGLGGALKMDQLQESRDLQNRRIDEISESREADRILREALGRERLDLEGQKLRTRREMAHERNFFKALGLERQYDEAIQRENLANMRDETTRRGQDLTQDRFETMLPLVTQSYEDRSTLAGKKISDLSGVDQRLYQLVYNLNPMDERDYLDLEDIAQDENLDERVRAAATNKLDRWTDAYPRDYEKRKKKFRRGK